MTSSATPTRAVRLAMWAVFAVFFLNGFNFSSWASRLPSVAEALNYDEGQMGLLLLFASFGSLMALPLSGVITHRIGPRAAVAIFAVVNVTGMVCAAVGVTLGSSGIVRVGLLGVGIGTGVWDAAMNLEGTAVEQALGKAIMPRFHAGFSFGTMAGAGLGAVAAAIGLPIQWHLIGALAVSLTAVLACVRWFLPSRAAARREASETGTQSGRASSSPGDPSPDPRAEQRRTRGSRTGALRAWTEPRTLLIGVVVLAAALTEGAANDWVNLAVVRDFHESETVGAASLAVFLTAMTAMRLLGTGLLDRYGRVTVLRSCSLLAAGGLLVFGLLPNLWGALIGVAMWGMGAALGFPVGISAASDDPTKAAVRVSVVATIGYTAFFVGPPLIGFLGDMVGLRHALLIILVPIVVGFLLVGVVRPLPMAVGASTRATQDTASAD